jgi:hypothetical protein
MMNDAEIKRRPSRRMKDNEQNITPSFTFMEHAPEHIGAGAVGVRRNDKHAFPRQEHEKRSRPSTASAIPRHFGAAKQSAAGNRERPKRAPVTEAAQNDTKNGKPIADDTQFTAGRQHKTKPRRQGNKTNYYPTAPEAEHQKKALKPTPNKYQIAKRKAQQIKNEMEHLALSCQSHLTTMREREEISNDNHFHQDEDQAGNDTYRRGTHDPEPEALHQEAEDSVIYIQSGTTGRFYKTLPYKKSVWPIPDFTRFMLDPTYRSQDISCFVNEIVSKVLNFLQGLLAGLSFKSAYELISQRDATDFLSAASGNGLIQQFGRISFFFVSVCLGCSLILYVPLREDVEPEIQRRRGKSGVLVIVNLTALVLTLSATAIGIHLFDADGLSSISEGENAPSGNQQYYFQVWRALTAVRSSLCIFGWVVSTCF